MAEGKAICPLLTTNTVVDENGKVSVGTQPVFCIKNSVRGGLRTNRNVQSQFWEGESNELF